jgi:UDP-glucuronate 4-epimerase
MSERGGSPRALVTGAAGFVGFHTCTRLLAAGWTVLGLDNFTPYYDVALKEARTSELSKSSRYTIERLDISELASLEAAWRDFAPDIVIHLAAQAGVRYSVEHPEAYVQSNLIGSFNVLEAARRHRVRHLLAASTSSVYGANTDMPFAETSRTATPLTFYAATKGATELMAHSYAHLYQIPTTFFRFFSLFGPWDRPDMALFKFTRAMLAGTAIDVYNYGEMVRDFTYVEDLVEAVMRLIACVPGKDPVAHDNLSPVAPFRIVNIGQGRPVPLMEYIKTLERCLGVKARLNLMPLQPGEVLKTEASPALLKELTGYVPETSVEVGMQRFVAWYQDFYGVKA